jgi:hypothetical protein
MISINGVEALWIGVNSLTLILTVIALFDAWHDLRIAAGADRRRARVLTARGNVRREGLRLVVQSLLLGVAIPGAFVDREINLTPPLMALIAVPVVLLISTLLDTRDRSRLAGMLLTDIAAERTALALETSVQENIELTKEVGQKADAAYNEANHVNVKLVELTRLIGGKEDKA